MLFRSSRFSEHIGKYPLVLVAPNDIELIWNGGEVRRKFLDTLLAQVDKEYLENLITYQAHLRQRNGSLKMMAEQGSGDPDLLELYNEKMAVAGMVLHLKRAAFVKEYLPLVSGRYDFLASGQSEEVGITYHSDLEGLDFKKELNANMHRDIAAGRTTLGVHRDDYLFTLKGHALKRFGSQGQQKSFLIALKLAEFDYLAAKNGTRPLILLDDIFDKLDDERILRLLELVTNETFGQVFITDARPGRSLEVLSHAGVIAQSFIVEEGNVTPSQPWQLN